jgi:hypothetical protein
MAPNAVFGLLHVSRTRIVALPAAPLIQQQFMSDPAPSHLQHFPAVFPSNQSQSPKSPNHFPSREPVLVLSIVHRPCPSFPLHKKLSISSKRRKGTTTSSRTGGQPFYQSQPTGSSHFYAHSQLPSPNPISLFRFRFVFIIPFRIVLTHCEIGMKMGRK